LDLGLKLQVHDHTMSSAASLDASLKASQRDWDNREFISAIQFSVLKMVEFLNRFGTPMTRCLSSQQFHHFFLHPTFTLVLFQIAPLATNCRLSTKS
jgi:hypothetical protein